MRVPDTTTSLIFSKYGLPVHYSTVLDLVAKAQYEIIRDIIAVRGDGPVAPARFEWVDKSLHIVLSRPLAREDLTWMMLADTVEGLRVFFDGLQGCFETSITILDDTAGPVGNGWLFYR